jgi:hypothetical protein
MNAFEHPEHHAIEALRQTRRAAAARMRCLLAELEAAEQEFEAATRELSRFTGGRWLSPRPEDHSERAG